MADPRQYITQVDGLYLPLLYPRYKDDPVKGLQAVKNFPTRSTDIIITATMKSGSHWLFEILSMLIVGELKYTEESLVGSHLDIMEFDQAEERSDPRILHTHLPFKYLPGDKDEKEYKIVHIMRNPKDREVSRHIFAQGKGGIPLDCSWNITFEELVMKPDKGVFGNCYKTWKEWETQSKKWPAKIHLLFYEDLKRNFVQTVQRLATFLKIDRSPSFYEKLEISCNLDNMKNNKPDDTVIFDPDGRKKLYRKGEIGDWKNYFTVAQNEKFDEMLTREMAGSNLKFTFE